ncbi:CobN component of cobalt chelatase involved in B12 biosynthesis [Hyphomicrobium sulfonivorans]|uniref:CobN component of cobalt chelatase involved in B12 biosynthesis n=1 Tax=Hyphomicrobium sulfonivorans TaxID=121290 RepID=A0A120CTY0_HYPSL|nr:cobaltochelatase subunit CobN [Hyphomicrobium sulfonivorans]KWT65370.1 CobN component of cobalt chelatase involved in B12 biosynthesis [Hyphomicrobium sulfonivorans]
MHLLATQSASLDEADIAVDLGQTAGDMVVLSFSDSDLSALTAAWKDERDALPSLRLASLKRLRHPMSVDLYIDQVVTGSRIVIVRSLGGLDYWRYGFEQLAEVCRRKGVHLVALPGDDRPDPRLAALSTVTESQAALFDAYFRHGGKENVGHALRLAAAVVRNEALEAVPPKPFGAAIFINANGSIASDNQLADYAARDGASALVVFYRSSLLASDTAPIEALMAQLRTHGIDCLGVALTSLKDPEAEGALTALMAQRRPSIIVNATAFSARRADDTTVLDAADCPVLQVALSGTSEEAWQDSDRGLSASDLAMNVVLPELDGRLFTRAISFKAEAELDPDLQYGGVHHRPVADRVAFVAALAANWVQLASQPRAERRVAVMLSDYPARGGRTGYACGLDTAASAREIVALLRGAGYAVGVDAWPDGKLIDCLTAPQPADCITLSLDQYRAHIASMPASVGAALREAWGDPADDPACIDGAFRFPCVRQGNVTIVLQPDRGSRGDRKQGYHDTSCPPRHSYVAHYAALRLTENIDALLHLGTHGTLEWLPGKALALSNACFPDAVLGPLPVVYPFIVNNPGEAVQAKRRIAAVTVGHLTPPLSSAGLYGGLAELEGLLEEYAEADGFDKRRIKLIEAEIIDRAWRSGLAADCGVTRDDVPQVAVAKLDAQLCDIKDLAIRDRLHIFGREPDTDAIDALTETTFNSLEESAAKPLHARIRELLSACAASERMALLAALDGRRVAPGAAGAPTRGRLDVLPTGRNLTTIDPRAVPTRTAAVIGTRAAEEVVRRHLQDKGEYPRAVMLDLWASASLRTGGDDIAQALSYLGVRPTWDHASNRVTGIEIMPMAKLERPRIDVTLRISGLFRDIFQSQIALLDMAVARVAALDEEDEFNPLAAARRRGESLARIFGGGANVYGAGTTDVALDTEWTSRQQLAEAYLAASSHAYGAHEGGTEAREQFMARIAAIDALVHPQDDRERDLLDGDGVADFVGGFAAAAELAGHAPQLYHIDTSKPGAPVARTIPEEIARVVRGRLTNPRWIAGMLEHGHRGVSEMAQAVDALYAFAATGSGVPSHLFEAVHDAIIADDAVRHAVLQANPAAAEAITNRLLDAIRRGLWVPRRNAVHGELELLRTAHAGAADTPATAEMQ